MAATALRWLVRVRQDRRLIAEAWFVSGEEAIALAHTIGRLDDELVVSVERLAATQNSSHPITTSTAKPPPAMKEESLMSISTVCVADEPPPRRPWMAPHPSELAAALRTLAGLADSVEFGTPGARSEAYTVVRESAATARDLAARLAFEADPQPVLFRDATSRRAEALPPVSRTESRPGTAGPRTPGGHVRVPPAGPVLPRIPAQRRPGGEH